MAHGRQRYRCKACGRSFTATPPRGKPPAMKALAVLLYALGNVSQGMIAKRLGVSHVAVYKWVRAAGEDAPAPSATPSSGIVQIDEMWHFVNGKKQGILLANSPEQNSRGKICSHRSAKLDENRTSALTSSTIMQSMACDCRLAVISPADPPRAGAHHHREKVRGPLPAPIFAAVSLRFCYSSIRHPFKPILTPSTTWALYRAGAGRAGSPNAGSR